MTLNTGVVTESENFPDMSDPEFMNGSSSHTDMLRTTTDDEQSEVMETAWMGHYFAWSYLILGIGALAINSAILAALFVSRRKLIYKNAFYVLIFNFTLIDLLKGLCLIVLALRLIRLDSTIGQFAAIRFNQYTNIVFRFCNLTTVLNVLMITLNEFMYIKYPFKYEHYVKRWMVLALIFINWALCALVTVGSIFARRTSRIPLVPQDYQVADRGRNIEHLVNASDFTNMSSVESFLASKSWGVKIHSDRLDINSIVTLTVIAFCLACLVVIVWCYISFIRIIKAIRETDSRLYNITGTVCSSAVPVLTATALSANTNGHQRSIAVGDVVRDSRDLVRDSRRLSMQVLKRNKYAIVIGSVILVYATYLVSYSTMQISQYSHLFGEFALSTVTLHNRLLIRWSLHVLVGLHSIFQPLCYFRMREFRHFAYKALCFPFYRLIHNVDSGASSFEAGLYGRSRGGGATRRQSLSHSLASQTRGRMNSVPLSVISNVGSFSGRRSTLLTVISSLFGSVQRVTRGSKEGDTLVMTAQSSNSHV